MTSPLISVVMPVYNAEKYVAVAIKSILNQTLTDFEFILIDDGSSDSSLAIMNKFAMKDSRIRLVSRENRGVAASLNEGIGMSSGRWIARMDADDISYCNRFSVQMQWLQQTGSDVCGGWIKQFRGPFNRICRYPIYHETIIRTLPLLTPFVHPTIIARRDLLFQYPYSEYRCAQDYILWFTLADKSVRFTNVPEVVLKYRVHSQQVSSTHKQQQSTYTHVMRREYLSTHYEEGHKTADKIEALFRCELNSQEISDIIGKLFNDYNHNLCDNHAEKKALSEFIVRLFRNTKNLSFHDYCEYRRTSAKFGINYHDITLLIQALFNYRKRITNA